MKNISFSLVILSLLIISCTENTMDTAESINNKISAKKSKKTGRLIQNQSPANLLNIYDYAGKLHNDILELYLAGNFQFNTIAEINQQIEDIVASNSNSMFLSFEAGPLVNVEEMQEIVNNPQSKLESIISNSVMTNTAKISLSNFMSDILLWKNSPYEDIYQSIVAYELAVINDTQFNDEDKRIILTTSSITRYSLYIDKERKDKDWGASVGNRVGGISGAINDSSTAVTKSLVIGIMINNSVTN